MASKTFFVKLKETCQKIDSDVNDIKMKMIVTPEDYDKEEVASKKIREIQDKISTMKGEACEIKGILGPKLAHTRDFIKNFKELVAETVVSISTKEEYLKQYGYTPMESVLQVPEIAENDVTPCKKVREHLAVTPNLLDYGISSSALTLTPELNLQSSIENLPVLPDLESANPVKSYLSDSTPTLDIANIISTSEPKETPPLPEQMYFSAKETPPLPEQVYFSAKETPPLPELLTYNSSNFPSTPKLNI